MENIISFRKKIIKHESEVEFYLNPKDIFINGKILDNHINNFYYLTLNELFVVLYDDNISIIDIKESISHEVKIIQTLNYRKIFLENFNLKNEKEKIQTVQEKEKSEKSSKQSESKKYEKKDENQHSKKQKFKSKDTLNFLSLEDDQSSIKNFLTFELKEKSFSLCLFFEFAMGDFLLVKYDDVRIQNYEIIYKANKHEHIKTLQNLIKASNIQFNISDLTDEKLSSTYSDMKYVQLNSQNFTNSSNSTNCSNIHLIIMRQSKFIIFATLEILNEINKSSLSFEVFHKTNCTVLEFIAKIFKNKLIIPQIKEDYNLQVDIFTLTYSIIVNNVSADIINRMRNNCDSKTHYKKYQLRMQHYHSQKINFTSSFFLNFVDMDMISFWSKNTFPNLNTNKNSTNINSSLVNTSNSSVYSNSTYDRILLFAAKLNQLFIYAFNDVAPKTNFNLMSIVNFDGLSNEKRYESFIKSAFIMRGNIFVFNSYGDYAIDTTFSETLEKLEISSNSNVNSNLAPTITFNNSFLNLDIPKEIFSIQKFKTELGFFILGTTNIFKIKDFTITYLLPKQFSSNKDITTVLIESSRKIFKNLLTNLNNKAHTTFFSSCLNEYLLMFYRNVDYISNVLLKDVDKILSYNLNSSDFLFNDYFSLLLWRINYFMSKKRLIKSSGKENSLDFSETQTIAKNFIVDKFRSILSGSIDDENDDYGFGEFLYNNSFKCEFCDSPFVNYDENKKIYGCSKGHSCLSCCVTYLPLIENENGKFYLCDQCNLIYSQNSFDLVLNDPMIDLKICLICQKILQNV